MVLDRRKTYEIAQALLRARDRENGDNILGNAMQSSAASGDGSYGEPGLGKMGFPFASQPGMTPGERAASQSHKFIPKPSPRPFRDLASFSDTGEFADMAKARGTPAHDQLAFKTAPSTLSRLANLQTAYGKPLAVNPGLPPYRVI